MTTPEQAVRLTFTVSYDDSVKRWQARAVADPSITGVHKMATLALTAAFREAEKRQRVAPYADPATADRHQIARIVQRAKRHDRQVPTVGWQARIHKYVPGKNGSKGKNILIASRFFNDSTYGGEGYALAQAIEWRDQFEFLRAMPLTKAVAKARALGIAGRIRINLSA